MSKSLPPFFTPREYLIRDALAVCLLILFSVLIGALPLFIDPYVSLVFFVLAGVLGFGIANLIIARLYAKARPRRNREEVFAYGRSLGRGQKTLLLASNCAFLSLWLYCYGAGYLFASGLQIFLAGYFLVLCLFCYDYHRIKKSDQKPRPLLSQRSKAFLQIIMVIIIMILFKLIHFFVAMQGLEIGVEMQLMAAFVFGAFISAFIRKKWLVQDAPLMNAAQRYEAHYAQAGEAGAWKIACIEIVVMAVFCVFLFYSMQSDFVLVPLLVGALALLKFGGITGHLYAWFPGLVGSAKG